MWFKALKSFHDDSRVPGWPYHCYLILTSKSAILTPPCTGGKDGRGQKGPKPCFPISIDVGHGMGDIFHQCLWVTKFCAKFGRSWIPRTARVHNSFIILRCMWKELAPLNYFSGIFKCISTQSSLHCIYPIALANLLSAMLAFSCNWCLFLVIFSPVLQKFSNFGLFQL